MNNPHFDIYWTYKAKDDLKDIYFSLKKNISKESAQEIREELYSSLSRIIFAEQFQIDEYRLDCRRIIVRNYKLLYQFQDNSIFIIRVFNTFQNPLKSLK
jgi:plasmid stabilization system protein ParE